VPAGVGLGLLPDWQVVAEGSGRGRRKWQQAAAVEFS